MKLTRRNFLKSGPITAIALAIGLKPNKVIRSPVVPLKHFTKGYVNFPFEWPSPKPMRLTQKQLVYIRNLWLEMEFLHGDPRFHCIGVLK